MSEPRSFMALDWVKGEIEDTLNRAREALESYVEMPDDVTQARQCLTSLHQVHGTLQMVELAGAATLAAEMEALAQALMNRTVVDEEAAQESLMEGILQLPSHLNRVHRGADDDPRVHALLMDRMRVARGEEPLNADLEVDPEAVAEFLAGNGADEIRKVRGSFQKAMVALLRGNQPAGKLYEFFDKVFARLEHITPQSPLKRLWGMAGGVMEIRSASGDEPGPLLPLMKSLDQQLKDLAESTEAALSAQPPAALVTGLTEIIEAASQDSPRLSALRAEMAGAAPPAAPIGADDETIAMVAVALHEELGSVRDRLDLFVRGNVSDAEGLASLGEDLQRVAGTLQVTGLDDLREMIARQAAWIRQQANQGAVDEEAIMEVASAVIYVDGELMRLGGIESDDAGGMPGSLSDAQTAVLREARSSLEAVKQGIVDFIASDWEHSHLEAVPGTLMGVKSVLELVPLERAAALIEASRSYVQDEILEPSAIPEWQKLDSLADALTSIDYYLERMIEDRVIPDPRLLEIADESIEQLGAESAPLPEIVAPPAAPEPVEDAFAPDDVAPVEPPDLEAEAAPAAEVPAEPEPEPEPELVGAPADDGASELTTPVEDDFDLGLENTGFYKAVLDEDLEAGESAGEIAAESAAEDDVEDLDATGIRPAAEMPDLVAAAEPASASTEDEPSGLAPPVEDDFDLDLGIDAAEPEVELSGAPVDDEPSELSAPVEDDFDLDLGLEAAEPEVELSGAPVDDEPSELSAPVEDAFDLDVGLDVAEPEVELSGAPRDDEASELTAPVEGDFDLDLGGIEEPAVAVPAMEVAEEPPLPVPETVVEEDDLIDDEIIEIFVEEIGEVLETLDAALPRWRASPSDTDALAEIRRSYHTLKGSGRVVGATELGELAWSVENMLNRVIDGTISASPAVVDLTCRVRELVPELRAAFAARTAPTTDFAPFMERADVLSSGGSPAELPDLPGAGDEAAAAPVAENSAGSAVAADDAAQSTHDRPSALTAPTETDFDLDDAFDVADGTEPVEADEPSLFEIFEQEAEEHMQVVRDFLQQAQNSAGAVLSEALRRALHTLKGSAAMADFPGISELAAPLEKLVRAYLDLHRPADATLTGIIQTGLERMEADLESLRQSGAERVFDAFENDYLQFAQEQLARLEADIRNSGTSEAPGQGASSVFSSDGIDLLLDATSILADWASNGLAERAQALRTELQNTADRARSAGQQRIADLAAALDRAHGALGDQLGPEAQPVLERAHEALVGTLDALAADLDVPAVDDNIAELETVASGSLQPEPLAPVSEQPPLSLAPEAEEAAEVTSESIAELDLDPEMVEIFFEEAEEIQETIEASLEGWPNGDADASNELMRALHTLKGGARMAGLSGLGEEAHDLETWIEERSANPDSAFFDELRQRADEMAERVAALRRGETVFRGGAPAAEAPLQPEVVMAPPVAEPPPVPETPRFEEPAAPIPTAPVEPVVEAPQPVVAEPVTPEPEPEPEPVPVPVADVVEAALSDDLSDTDPEILALFLEEAAELTEMLDGSLQGWRDEPDNEIHLESVLRVLHTLKGGARMAGLMALGEAVHDLETRLIDSRGKGGSLDAAFLSGIQNEVDALSERLGTLGGAPDAAQDATSAPEPSLPLPELEPEPAPAVAAPEPALPEPVVAATPEPAPVPVAAPAAPAAAAAAPPASDAASKETPQEMIRVSAGLLDDLVNLAGETSIMRGRVQQEISDFGLALDELSATIARIRDQVRRLDSEAQEQVHSRQEAAQRAEKAGYDDFDPLEMDRYTQLQELARTLAESASDVSDLRDTLAERLRDTDTLLIQQGRINTELQEGLMRTRMVPFARLLPRLKRIVRQVGRELGKPVDLKVENAEGELDRNVLERMIAPLEHMLRNAVDHGLEAPEVRVERGKSEQGTITLRLDREGGDIVVEVADDGGGINASGVRAKAVERGLLAAEAEVEEAEILAFIMSAGFSTAKSVTQISGRGVGMDVVNSEVKQLGGSISIASTLGEGTAFTVRLPFTVSVNRALMVTVGNDQFAVPLSGIEGIVRVSPQQLKIRYQGEGANFAYAGRTYGLSYLGEWLGDPRSVREDVSSIPIIMVRSGDFARAVHVDGISGSREIVVKSLGAQFAGVSGVSGATILGDGSVVVILDLPALLRTSSSISLAGDAPEVAPERGPQHVMVVDDSVTVRKVTTRLLERKGYRVSVAKDGIEAVAALSEERPDVMLLDIEMPRMDGFEVATHVRSEAGLTDLPIIMITSRTGDKHRERAEAIGVNRFLGKPFQEPELLATIEELIGA